MRDISFELSCCKISMSIRYVATPSVLEAVKNPIPKVSTPSVSTYTFKIWTAAGKGSQDHWGCKNHFFMALIYLSFAQNTFRKFYLDIQHYLLSEINACYHIDNDVVSNFTEMGNCFRPGEKNYSLSFIKL